MKHVQKMMLVPEHLLQRTPINIPTATRNTHAFGSRHETDHGFFINRRPKNQFAGSTFAQYQGLSRQIKTEATVKPTVVTNVTLAPTEASPTHTPTMSLGKSAKVRARKLSVTPRLSASKIPRPVGTASPSAPTP